MAYRVGVVVVAKVDLGHVGARDASEAIEKVRAMTAKGVELHDLRVSGVAVEDCYARRVQ